MLEMMLRQWNVFKGRIATKKLSGLVSGDVEAERKFGSRQCKVKCIFFPPIIIQASSFEE